MHLFMSIYFHFSGAPIVMSLPHFLFSDPIVLDSVQGLAPDPAVHNTYFNVEPVSTQIMTKKKLL